MKWSLLKVKPKSKKSTTTHIYTNTLHTHSHSHEGSTHCVEANVNVKGQKSKAPNYIALYLTSRAPVQCSLPSVPSLPAKHNNDWNHLLFRDGQEYQPRQKSHRSDTVWYNFKMY